MSKYTPGPLTAIANEVVQRGNNIDRHIATCHCPFENGDADARLFAASPMLLEALRKLFNEVSAYGNPYCKTGKGNFISNAGREFQSAMDMAEAAIAKAEGRDK